MIRIEVSSSDVVAMHHKYKSGAISETNEMISLLTIFIDQVF